MSDLVKLAPIDALLNSQTKRGSFPSRVLIDQTTRPVDDENAFVTAQIALILIALRREGFRVNRVTGIHDALSGALDFLETCGAPHLPGAYRFYSNDSAASRLDIDIPPDADDTALIWTALVLGGRLRASQAREALIARLQPIVAGARQRHDAPWVRAGAVRTWLEDMAPNPVDLCVQANILGALQTCGLSGSPLAEGISATMHGGLRRMAGNPALLRRAAPFYAHPAELSHALLRASLLGVSSCVPLFETLAHFEAQDVRQGRPVDRPLYCNAHGRPIWVSPPLQRARRCADLLLAQPITRTNGESDVLHATLYS